MGFSFFKKRKSGIILAVFCCLFSYVLFLEPFWIQVREITITDEPFSLFFKTYKTVLISDIHASKLGFREQLLIEKINEISPDIIFLAGDYVAWGGDYERGFGVLSRLKANVEIFGVLGDSDYQNSRKTCNFCHNFGKNKEALPVRFLRNETVYLRVGESNIAVSGVEIFQADLTETKKFLQRNLDCPEILLSHKQIELSRISDRPVFVLSGDTHGGQVYMPAKIWRKFFGRSKGKIRAGMIEEGNKKLFVSSGIGTNHIPFRFLCPPEIVVFKGE